jgi:hypothetical protein
MSGSSDSGLSGHQRPNRKSPRLWLLALVFGCGLLVAAGLSNGDLATRDGSPPPIPPLSVPPSTFPYPSPSPSSSAVPVVPAGDGSFSYADGMSTVAGSSGPLLRYRVAVEGGLGIDAEEFASGVDAVLTDPRSWTAGATVRMQRVPPDTAVDFTVLLASPVTSEQLCRTEGNLTEQFTNCRLRGRIVINSARWLTAVPDYGAPLSVYRAYAVNHEVGHELGLGHELCPGPGQPAPVMQQQTLGLQGCVANAWPYLDGVRYQGPAASA